MGLVHKRIKSKNLEPQNQSIMEPTTTAENLLKGVDSDLDLVPTFCVGGDNQFTTEKIIQLCRFLAEKSMKNKSTRVSPANNRTKHTQLVDNCSESANVEVEALDHKLRSPSNRHQHFRAFGLHATNQHTKVSTNKLFTNTNFVDNIYNLKSPVKSKLEKTHRKSDILLKIRYQILERKRRRQVGEQQLDVWRPW